MEYKTSHEKPPVFDRCVQEFGIKWEDTVFTYGDTIHSAREIPDDVLAHELIHVRQQSGFKDEWWNSYFVDTEFRLEQELEAYQAQYRWVLKNIKDRNTQTRMLLSYASALSGSMYGNVVSLSEALTLIRDVR